MNISDIFSSVESPDYPISQFDGNHFVQTTLSIGSLTPTKVIKYHPGDNFKLHSVSNVECPPLLSPSFQSYKLKEFMFKVRKGLTWKNDEYGKFVKSLHDGSVAPVMPFIKQDADYCFGDAVLRIKFNPKLPVYGLIHTNANGVSNIEFQTSQVPSGSLNDTILNISSLSSEAWAALVDLIENSFSFEIVYQNKLGYVDSGASYSGYDEGIVNPAYTRYNVACAQPAVSQSPIDVRVPLANATVDTFNSVTFARLGLVHNNLVGMFLDKTPFCRPSELLEALGYPAQILDAESIDYVDLFKKNLSNFCNELRSGNFTATIRDLFFYENQYDMGTTIEGDYYLWPLPNKVSLTPVNNFEMYGHTMTIGTLLQMYAEFMIGTGHGNGSPMDEDNMFSIQDIKLKDIMLPAFGKALGDTQNSFMLDLGPLTSFWLIWNEYFRDASLSSEIGLLLDSGSYLNARTHVPILQSMRDVNTYQVTSPNGVTYDYDLPTVFDNQQTLRAELSNDLVYRFYTSLPQKCIDRNYFTSALPDISKVQVFAPVVPTLPANGVVPSMDGKTDYKPTQSVNPSTSFMSIDAFRTANVLEAFFQNSMLAGPRPVSLILMHFGEHSKDFRMEIPEMIDASEQSFSTRELTQSSETEQLPLGFQVSQMSIVKGLNERAYNIDSDGDHGYIIRMVCLYPEIFEVGGLNRDLICDSPFDWMYLPAFGVLGEQSICQFELNAQPLDVSASGFDVADMRTQFLLQAPNGYESDFGYTARYGHLKRIRSEVHGRFLRDLRYWNLNRIQQPLSFNDPQKPVPLLKTSMQFLAVPKDTRMFVDKDQDNFKLYQFVDGQFTRKLPMINVVKLL